MLARLHSYFHTLQGTNVVRNRGICTIHLRLDVQFIRLKKIRILSLVVEAVQAFQGTFHLQEHRLVVIQLLFQALLGLL